MMSQSGAALALPLAALLAFAACARGPCPPAAAPSTAVAAAADDAPDPHLVAFSQATCLALYLEAKGWDPESARNIAGGHVELGTRSGEAYAALSNFIRDYEPALSTQQRIDKQLLRCFHLDDSAEWQRLVRAH
jgi:hypothetical protein